MTTINAIKTLTIGATTAYPIVSAYEYATLKDDEIVQSLTQDATIYFILQRPLMYFDNLNIVDGSLTFDIVDGVNAPLHGTLDPWIYAGVGADDEVAVEVGWYRGDHQTEMPFKEVAAFHIRKADGTHVAWETPQKLLYEVLVNKLDVKIKGDVAPYLQYRVHYIGKAIKMEMWERLMGHQKFQETLMREMPLSKLFSTSQLEISILMLSIDGFSDHTMTAPFEALLPAGVKPIVAEFGSGDEDAFVKYNEPLLTRDAPALTTEVEAMLIHEFRPGYNDTMFDNYPEIANGTRAAGYTHADLFIARLPAELLTDHYRLQPRF
jgi:hypothetical protein